MFFLNLPPGHGIAEQEDARVALAVYRAKIHSLSDLDDYC